jgi:biopolymer transport protein ExbD
VKFRASRQRRRGRIEIIPMIDVMFFLLATFMLASLSLQNLHSMAVSLPRGAATPMQTASPVTLTVTREGALLLNESAVTLESLPGVLRSMLGGTEARIAAADIIVATDSAAPSGIVVQAMLRARSAGAQHFLLAVTPK